MPDRVALGAVSLLVSALLTACGTGPDSSTTSVGDRSTPGDADGATRDGVPTVAPGTPCPGAVHGDPVTLAAVSRAPVYLPRDRSARVTDAWRCGSTPVFMLGDVQLSFEPGWEDVRIPEKLEALASDYGGSVVTIQGLPAWVAPSSASASNDEVLMVRSGAAIKLLARGGVPIGDLVAVARTLDLGAAISR